MTVAGTLNLNDNSDTIGALVLTGGTVETETGTLTLGGNITTNAAGTPATISGFLNLGGATRTVTVASGTDLIISADISGGEFGLTKAGTGTLTLSGVNTYTGTTTVIAGALDGSGTLDGAVKVGSGATLAPGRNTTAILNTGAVTLASGSTFNVTLNGTVPGSGYDQLNTTGAVNLANATLNVNLTFTPLIGSTFIIIQNDGSDPIVGTFKGLPEGQTLVVNGMTFKISYKGGTGNDVVLTRIA